jgi:hypothetical protein
MAKISSIPAMSAKNGIAKMIRGGDGDADVVADDACNTMDGSYQQSH